MKKINFIALVLSFITINFAYSGQRPTIKMGIASETECQDVCGSNYQWQGNNCYCTN